MTATAVEPTCTSDGFGQTLRRILASRATHVAIIGWIAANAAAYWIAGGMIPFDMPALSGLSFNARMAAPTITLIEIFGLMAIAFWMTRKRAIPDMAARAPARGIAARETALLIAYAATAQVGGWLLGPALGYRAFSFHIAGTLLGCAVPPSLGEMWVWMSYNLIVFAVLPLLWFRRRYSARQLNLASSNRWGDLRLILVILLVESGFELAGLNADFLALSPRQMLVGGAATLFFYGLGTVIPTMILIYAILLPRYLALTRSAVMTVLLGGLSYAALHLVEGWSLFTSARWGTLSVLFVLLQYVGPGMIKSVLTLRTGNAWVHAIGYHLIAPHMIIDTPLFVKALAIR